MFRTIVACAALACAVLSGAATIFAIPPRDQTRATRVEGPGAAATVATATVTVEKASTSSSSAATVAQTWCGAPLGLNGSRVRRDMSDCTKVSLTGTAPCCVFCAECGEGEEHVAIDCASAGEGWCRCDGPMGRLVPFDPAFCALDPESPKQSLHAILAKGAVACRWTSP